MEKLTNGQMKDIASRVLDLVARDAARPTTPEGDLDVEAFNNLPEVLKAKDQLSQIGIDQKWLFDNGFVPAGMVLRFNKDEN